jgi:hypothetical protein
VKLRYITEVVSSIPAPSMQLLTDMFLNIVREAAESKATRLRNSVSASNGADGWIAGMTVEAVWDEGGYVAEDASTMEYDRSFDEEMANKVCLDEEIAVKVCSSACSSR